MRSMQALIIIIYTQQLVSYARSDSSDSIKLYDTIYNDMYPGGGCEEMIHDHGAKAAQGFESS